MQKSFSFKGIARESDNLLSKEGECLDVVNMRMINNSLKPLPRPVEIVSLDCAYSAAYWHEMSGCHICITSGTGMLHFYDKDWNAVEDVRLGEELRNGGLGNVKNMELLGNIVCCFTDESISYLIYDSGKYRLLGERPPVPVLDISLKSKLQIVSTDTKYAINATPQDFEASWEYNEKGYIDKCISLLNSDGYYVDRALFRFALRLYDGSYVYTSHIIYACDQCYDDGVGRDSRNMQSETKGEVDDYAHFTVKVRGFKPEFSFSNLALDEWKGIVVGIDVFTTGSLPGKKVETVHGIHSDPEEGISTQVVKEVYKDKELDKLHDEILSASLYYKIAEFDIYGNEVSSVDDVSDVNLVLQQGLQSQQSSGTLSTFAVGCSCVLNNRLHIASLKEYFFKGYDASSFCPVGEHESMVESVVVHTRIETPEGAYILENNLGSIVVGKGHNTYELPPLISYPDARATEMTVYLYDDTELFVKKFPLTPHKFLNLSQYLHKWYSPYTVTVEAYYASGASAAYISDNDVLEIFSAAPGVHEVVYSETAGSWVYNGRNFPDDKYRSLRIFAIRRDIKDGDRLVFTIAEGVSNYEPKDIYNIPFDSTWQVIGGAVPSVAPFVCEERWNVLKVSLVDNPFTFLPDATYAPSQERIVAMSSNTVALSQGQFGEHPLYLFCNDGIWALAVDTSGNTAYTGCFPLSREKCVNSCSVCGIDSGVVYAGEQGLMLLQGTSLRKISRPMDDVVDSREILGSVLFKNIASLVSMEGCAEVYDFRTYLSKAILFYLAPHNEVVMTLGDVGYSYLYSFAYGTWSRLSWSAGAFVRGYPTTRMLLTNMGVTTVMELCGDVAGSNKVLLFTRPQLFGTKLRKRVAQLMLHCYAVPSADYDSSVPLLNCYMLCSNDGVNFKVVAGVEKKKCCKDVVFPYYPTQSYRYYLFAIAGNLDGASLLTGIELDMNLSWNNRMG